MPTKITGRAKGGVAVAKSMTQEELRARAEKGAIARWGYKAIHKGTFQEDFGIDAECYVLNDKGKTPVISQRGMAKILGFSLGGDRLSKFITGKKMSGYAGAELLAKLEKIIIFQWGIAGAKQIGRAHV